MSFAFLRIWEKRYLICWLVANSPIHHYRVSAVSYAKLWDYHSWLQWLLYTACTVQSTQCTQYDEVDDLLIIHDTFPVQTLAVFQLGPES